jgi:GTPase SAR1 family protein
MMPEDETTPRLNIIFLGDSGVGKSSILKRLIGFGDDRVKVRERTDGVEFASFPHVLPGSKTNVILNMYDCAGEGSSRHIVANFFRGVHAAVLVYDVNRRETFRHLRDEWLPRLMEENARDEHVPLLLLLGNKSDLTSELIQDKLPAILAKDAAILSQIATVSIYSPCSAHTWRFGRPSPIDQFIGLVLQDYVVRQGDPSKVPRKRNTIVLVDHFDRIRQVKKSQEQGCCEGYFDDDEK